MVNLGRIYPLCSNAILAKRATIALSLKKLSSSARKRQFIITCKNNGQTKAKISNQGHNLESNHPASFENSNISSIMFLIFNERCARVLFYLLYRQDVLEFNQQSAISNQQSAISNQQSAISNQQSAISNQQSAISNQLFQSF